MVKRKAYKRVVSLDPTLEKRFVINLSLQVLRTYWEFPGRLLDNIMTLLNHNWKRTWSCSELLCSRSGNKLVQKFTELLVILSLVVRQIEN